MLFKRMLPIILSRSHRNSEAVLSAAGIHPAVLLTVGRVPWDFPRCHRWHAWEEGQAFSFRWLVAAASFYYALFRVRSPRRWLSSVYVPSSPHALRLAVDL